MQTITTRSQRFSPVRILAIGLILYAFAFAILLRNRSFEPAGAIVVLVLFGGAGEVEGLGSNPSAIDAIAYSIVVLAVSGITFGIIWARTKNLFALMLIHAAGDLLPNFGRFVRTWF